MTFTPEYCIIYSTITDNSERIYTKAEDKDMEYGPDLLTLVDEEGVEHEFEVVDTLDKDDETYFALVPVMDESNISDVDGELVILKVVEEDGEEFLEAIEDDDEFDDISDIFMERLEELYDFEEENEKEDE